MRHYPRDYKYDSTLFFVHHKRLEVEARDYKKEYTLNRNKFTYYEYDQNERRFSRDYKYD